jgi:hypothetical protein
MATEKMALFVFGGCILIWGFTSCATPPSPVTPAIARRAISLSTCRYRHKHTRPPATAFTWPARSSTRSLATVQGTLKQQHVQRSSVLLRDALAPTTISRSRWPFDVLLVRFVSQEHNAESRQARHSIIKTYTKANKSARGNGCHIGKTVDQTPMEC